MSCGVSGGSKRSWRGWGSRSLPELLPNTCASRMGESHRRGGGSSLRGTRSRSGPATSSVSKPYGSRPSTPSSLSATPAAKCCILRSRSIRLQSGSRSRSWNAVAGTVSRLVSWYTTGIAASGRSSTDGYKVSEYLRLALHLARIGPIAWTTGSRDDPHRRRLPGLS